MIYGAIEHRTWAFLRDEGDFHVEETADGVTELIYRGLVARKASDPLVETVARLQTVADQLEALSKSSR